MTVNLLYANSSDRENLNREYIQLVIQNYTLIGRFYETVSVNPGSIFPEEEINELLRKRIPIIRGKTIYGIDDARANYLIGKKIGDRIIFREESIFPLKEPNESLDLILYTIYGKN